MSFGGWVGMWEVELESQGVCNFMGEIRVLIGDFLGLGMGLLQGVYFGGIVKRKLIC